MHIFLNVNTYCIYWCIPPDLMTFRWYRHRESHYIVPYNSTQQNCLEYGHICDHKLKVRFFRPWMTVSNQNYLIFKCHCCCFTFIWYPHTKSTNSSIHKHITSLFIFMNRSKIQFRASSLGNFVRNLRDSVHIVTISVHIVSIYSIRLLTTPNPIKTI